MSRMLLLSMSEGDAVAKCSEAKVGVLGDRAPDQRPACAWSA